MENAQLYQYFKNSGLRLGEISSRIGLDYGYTSSLLHGKAKLTDSARFKIIKAFPRPLSSCCPRIARRPGSGPMTEPLKITLGNCYLDSVKADMVKGTVKITFETRLDEQVLAAKRNLTILSIDETPLTLDIIEDQLRMTFDDIRPAHCPDLRQPDDHHPAHRRRDRRPRRPDRSPGNLRPAVTIVRPGCPSLTVTCTPASSTSAWPRCGKDAHEPAPSRPEAATERARGTRGQMSPARSQPPARATIPWPGLLSSLWQPWGWPVLCRTCVGARCPTAGEAVTCRQ